MNRFYIIVLILGATVLFDLTIISEVGLANENAELQEIQQLIHKADSLKSLKQNDSALVIVDFAIEKTKKYFREPDIEFADALEKLGEIHIELALHVNESYEKRIGLFLQALKIREKLQGLNDINVAKTLYKLGETELHRCRFSEVIKYYLQSLDIQNLYYDPGAKKTITLRFQIGILYRILCRYSEADSVINETLQNAEAAYGLHKNTLAGILLERAISHSKQARYSDAEKDLKRALDICSRTESNNTIGHIHNYYGNIYFYQGKYEQAEQSYKRSLEFLEAAYGPDNRIIGEPLSSLGLLYEIIGEYTKAEVHLLKALEVRKAYYGSNHPFLMYSLLPLGDVYVHENQPAKAESLYLWALYNCETTYGENHENVSSCLRYLGNLYRHQGEYSKAELHYTRAADILETILGQNHPDITELYFNLSLVYGSTGEYEKYLKCTNMLLQSRYAFLNEIFSYASEEQKMRYIGKYPLINSQLLSFTVTHKIDESLLLALEMILKSKAKVLDVVSKEKEIIHCKYDERHFKVSDAYLDTRSKIANSTLNEISGTASEQLRIKLEALYNIKDSLEIELSRFCFEFGEELLVNRFTVKDIVNTIPQNTSLIEFIRYEPYDFKKIGSDEERTGLPRYMAFTFDGKGNIALNDLGDAGEIDSLVHKIREMIDRDKVLLQFMDNDTLTTALKQETSKLYEIIFAPLESSFDNRTEILISPDGQLNLLPFEILLCSDGRYLIEKYGVSYLSSGRDLLKYKKKPKYSNCALAMANPDFDCTTSSQLKKPKSKSSTSLFFGYEPSRGVSGCLKNRFNSLPYTQVGADSVVKMLREKTKFDVQTYYGAAAREEVLKGMTVPPWVLHISTHAYFCDDLDLTENMMLENPLLRCGMALAGANCLIENADQDSLQKEDGILTAFEASGLNLTGTELVTLSACETGVGEVRNGEGVYGLRRAFQQAGARSILMSLWEVPDKQTSDLMINFYRNWLEGKTKKAALREASLEMIKNLRTNNNAAHPYYWGAFVLLGDPH
ncbi:MAG: CHAT domain-containing protein [candidate division Zixibacteria bacterium]|nr:CHAT domain-containing protein [candidate division Zixibacteria bacterium]